METREGYTVSEFGEPINNGLIKVIVKAVSKIKSIFKKISMKTEKKKKTLK